MWSRVFRPLQDFVWVPNAPRPFQDGQRQVGPLPGLPMPNVTVAPGRFGHPANVLSGRTKPSGQ